jgi:hypothetical protein
MSGEFSLNLRNTARALWSIYFLMVAVMGLSLYLSYAIKTSCANLELTDSPMTLTGGVK